MGCTESRSAEKENSNDSDDHFTLTKDLQYIIYDCIVMDDDQRLQDGLNNGFDINLTMDHFANRTLLHISCELGSVKIVKLLVKKGCDLNKADDYGMTPVLLATLKGQKQCVRILKQAGICMEGADNCFDDEGDYISEKNKTLRLSNTHN